MLLLTTAGSKGRRVRTGMPYLLCFSSDNITAVSPFVKSFLPINMQNLFRICRSSDILRRLCRRSISPRRRFCFRCPFRAIHKSSAPSHHPNPHSDPNISRGRAIRPPAKPFLCLTECAPTPPRTPGSSFRPPDKCACFWGCAPPVSPGCPPPPRDNSGRNP